MINTLFNKLKSIDRGDGFNSYCGDIDLYDNEGNKKGKITVEIPKARFEDGKLMCYSSSPKEFKDIKPICIRDDSNFERTDKYVD